MAAMRRLQSGADGQGTDYEYKIPALWAMRLRLLGHRFQMFSNAEGAHPFDDVVIRVTHPADALLCVQLKHKKRQLTLQSFVSGADFGLRKYFPVCRKIHELRERRQNGESLSGDDDLLSQAALPHVWFVLFTTAEVNSFVKTHCGTELQFPWEEVFNTNSSERSFSFHCDHNQIWKLWEKMEENEPPTNELFQKHFLPRLKVFSSQAQADDVDALLTNELNALFGAPLPRADLLTQQLLQRFKAWACDKRGRCVSEASGELERSLAEELRRRARAAAGDGAFRFRGEQCAALRDALRAPGALRVCVGDVPAGHRAARLLQLLDEQLDEQRDEQRDEQLDEQRDEQRDEKRKGEWVYVDERVLAEYPVDALKAVCAFCQVLVLDVEKHEMDLFRLVATVERDIKVVKLCSDSAMDTLVGAGPMFTDNWELGHLEDVCQERMMEARITFQGERMRLGDLAPAWPQLRSQVDGALLSALARGDAAVGAPVDAAAGGSDDVPLTLQHHCALDPAVLSQLDPRTDHLALSGFSQRELEQLAAQISKDPSISSVQPLEHKWTVLDHSEEWNVGASQLAFENTCRANPRRSVHWIHKAGERLTWRATAGRRDAVLRHVQALSGGCPPARGPLCEHGAAAAADVAAWDARVFLLLGAPGAGKTHFLRRAAARWQREQPARWALVVDLLAQRELLLSMSERQGVGVDDVLELLAAAAAGGAAAPLTAAARRCLRAALLETGAAAVVLDGVDEVAPSYSATVLRLLELLLRETKAQRVWVASRPEVGQALSGALRCAPSRLLPLSRAQQEQFLRAQWAAALRRPHAEVQRLAAQMVDAFARVPGAARHHFPSWTIPALADAVAREIFNSLPDFAQEKDQLAEANTMPIKKKCQDALETVLKERGGEIQQYIKAAFLTLVEEVLKQLAGVLAREEKTTLADALRRNLREIASNVVDVTFGGDASWGSLLGAPLHLGMAAEAFAPDAQTALTSGGSLLEGEAVHPDLFERFVGLKKTHYREKHGLTLGNTENSYLRDGEEEIFRRLHQSHAMVVWSSDFPESERQVFLDAAEKSKPYLAREKNGFLWELDNGGFEFAHFTLVEYFVASWLFDNRVNAARYIRRAFQQRSGSCVPLFLDYALSKGWRVHRAVLAGDPGALEAALTAANGAAAAVDEDVDEGRRSPLHLAAAHGRLEAVDRLLEAGYSVGARDSLLGWTPLQYADAGLQLQAAERLLRAGADAQQLHTIASSAVSDPSVSLDAAAQDLHKIISYLLRTQARQAVLHGFQFETEVALQMELTGMNKPLSQPDTQKISSYSLTPILVAAQNNSIEVAKILLQGGANVNTHNMETPLHAASRLGHTDMVDILLSFRADTECAGLGATTALYIAAGKGHLHVVEKLLDARAKVDACTAEQATPLHVSAQEGHWQVVKTLVDAGADVDARTANKETPLHYAAYDGHLQAVETLLDAGVDVHARTAQDVTPLHLAAQEGHWQVAQKLLDAGADVGARAIEGATPLYLAAQGGHWQVVEKLVNAGAEVDARTAKEETPLRSAAYNGHLQVVEMLLDAGADVLARAAEGETPLHAAACNGHLHVVEKLVDAGVDVNARKTDNRTPLHMAVNNGHLDIVEKLVEAGAEVDALDEARFSPLYCAAFSGHPQIMEILLRRGANPNTQNSSGWTPMHAAALAGHAGVVEVLLRSGANPNTQNSSRWTPMHAAALAGHAGVVEVLLAAGARWDVRDSGGRTPLQEAVAAGRRDVAWILWAAAAAPVVRRLLQPHPGR